MDCVKKVEVRHSISEPFEFLISWQKADDVIGYNIYVSEGILSYKNIKKVNTDLITQTHFKVESSQTPVQHFYFFVVGVDSHGRETPMDIYGKYITYLNSFEGNAGFSYIASVTNEVFGEKVNGSGVYYSAKFPVEETKLRVYKNGMRLKEGVDYIFGNNNEITLPLPVDDDIVVDYWIRKRGRDGHQF